MIEAVAAHGYAATTVDEVVGLAGVSTKTLYKHFSSKQDCLLCTYDAVMEELAGRVVAAWREGSERDRDRTAGLSRGLHAFVREIARQPNAARLALVETLAAGPVALERIERAQLVFERMIACGLRRASGGAEPSPVVARGVAGGIWHVARARLLGERTESPAELGDKLLRWMLSYRSAAALPPASSLLDASADGRTRTTRCPPTQRLIPLRRTCMPDVDQRTRIVLTAARIAAREGYAELSVARILDEAEVPDETFFALYTSAEECFVAALELLSAQALARVARAGRGAPDWVSTVHATVGSLMGCIAEDPVFARCAFVEVFAAGTAGVACRERLLRRLSELVSRVPDGRFTPVLAEAIVGAVWSIVHHQVVRDAAHELPRLTDQVVHVAMAPRSMPRRPPGRSSASGPLGERRVSGRLVPLAAEA